MERFYNSVNNVTSSSDGLYTTMIEMLGLKSPRKMRAMVLGILTICMLGFSFDAFAQPANDDCANAIALTLDAACTTGDNTLATADPEVGGCFSGGSNGIWFSFVAPVGGAVDVSTDFAGFTSGDTEIAIFDGCGGTEVACDQDGGGTENFNSVITGAAVTAGATYFIQVSGWNGTQGTFCLEVITTPPAAANDLCSGAIEIPVGSNGVCNFTVGTNVSSTDSGELPVPSCASYNGGDSWYTITVPATGNIDIDMGNTGGITDGGMSIYAGSCGVFTEVECNDDDSDDGLFPFIALNGHQHQHLVKHRPKTTRKS